MVWEIWDPFEDMKRMQKQMEQTFRDFYRKPVKSEKSALIREPLADVIETKKDVIAKLELPGIEKKDIELNVTENMLSVKAEKKSEVKEKEKGFFRHERSYQSFQRAFSLPAKVKPGKAVAKLENGILEITIPKKKLAQIKEKKTRRIPIK